MKLNLSPQGIAMSAGIGALIYFLIDVVTGGDVGHAVVVGVILGLVIAAVQGTFYRTVIARRRRP